jgi:hypothetical protein
MTPQPPWQRPQISISLMLLMMSIFAIMSAGLFYASRVGEIRNEMAVLTGTPTSGAEPPDRVAHLVFLLFTYTSPLLLALVLGGLYSWQRARYPRRPG